VKKGVENIELRKLVAFLEKTGRKNNARVWLDSAKHLSKPSRKKRVVSLDRLEKIVEDGEDSAIVLSKILGNGSFSKNAVIAFASASKTALTKLGPKAIPLKQFVEKNPSGKNTRIVV
jgi:ribosomal protein L18E